MTEYITNQGYSLLSRMLSGECTINFTRVEMGNGEPTESDLKRVTALASTVCSIDVESVQINEDKTVDITATFTNTEISTQFYFKEKGVFVTDGSKEILFSYAYTRDPELIPPSTESFMEKRLKTVMKQLQDTTAEINIQVKSGIYAFQEDMDHVEQSIADHLADKENPHGVTKKQVGLENVPNVTTNDQTPTYTESTSLTTLTSGEKISVAFGKIKKAISSLISHIADKVSHITAAERTAWNSKAEGNHKHTKSEITDFPSSLKNPNALSINGKTYDGSSATDVGVMGASYGGTGKTSLTDSANALINALSTGTSTPEDNDYYVAQYAGGGTSTTTYHRRPMSALWNYIKSKLSTVATSGSYSDLSNKPTIPSVGNGTVTIKQAGTSKGSFTMNQSGNTTIELTDNNTVYSLPTASSSTLGGVKTGSNITNSSGTISLTKTNVVNALGYTPSYSGQNIFTDSSTNTVYGSYVSNGNVHLNHIESGSVKSSQNIKGTGGTTVTTNNYGNLVIDSPSVQNNLTSTSTTNALSAYQGKLLNDKINDIMGGTGSVYITSAKSVSANGEIITKTLSYGTYLIMIWLSNSSTGGGWFGNNGALISDTTNSMYGAIPAGGCLFKVHTINSAQTVGIWNGNGKTITVGAGTCLFYMKVF